MDFFERRRRFAVSAVLCGIVLTGAPVCLAQGATLRAGDWTLDGRTLRVPIRLEGDVGDGVSAMDFRIYFDETVFEPVAVSAGRAALDANKLVDGNVVAPGEYIVLLFGINQNALVGGEVAIVDLLVLSAPDSGSSRIQIGDTTLSSPSAVDVPSRGSSRPVPFDGDLPRVNPVEDAAEDAASDRDGGLTILDDGAIVPPSLRGDAPAGGNRPAAPGQPERPRGGFGGATTVIDAARAQQARSGLVPAPKTEEAAPAPKSAASAPTKDLMAKIREAEILRANLPDTGSGIPTEEPDADDGPFSQTADGGVTREVDAEGRRQADRFAAASLADAPVAGRRAEAKVAVGAQAEPDRGSAGALSPVARPSKGIPRALIGGGIVVSLFVVIFGLRRALL